MGPDNRIECRLRAVDKVMSTLKAQCEEVTASLEKRIREVESRAGASLVKDDLTKTDLRLREHGHSIVALKVALLDMELGIGKRSREEFGAAKDSFMSRILGHSEQDVLANIALSTLDAYSEPGSEDQSPKVPSIPMGQPLAQDLRSPHLPKAESPRHSRDAWLKGQTVGSSRSRGATTDQSR